MTKRKIFWAGTNIAPAAETKRLPDSEQFVADMTSVCASHGCEVRRFLSASGSYGSWLLEFDHGGLERRVVWDGKMGSLTLEKLAAHGKWETVDQESLSNPDETVFGEGLSALIERGVAPPA
ncbi:MAG: hypothetical protein ACR2P6_08860 [Gammaproteobacteria bacterium]